MIRPHLSVPARVCTIGSSLARSFLHFRNFFKSEGVGRLVPAESFLQFRIFSKSEGIERLVPAESFLHFRSFSKSEGIERLVPVRLFLQFRIFFKSEGIGRLVPARSFLHFRSFFKFDGVDSLASTLLADLLRNRLGFYCKGNIGSDIIIKSNFTFVTNHNVFFNGRATSWG